MTGVPAPAVKLTFRSGGGAGPRVGKVVDTTTEPAASTVTRLVVELGMGAAADQVALTMGQVGPFQPEIGQSLDVVLGYVGDTELEPVIAESRVVDVEAGLIERRVVALGPAEVLDRTFVDRTFISATAGSIVRELAAAAGVDVAVADDGITFPAYVIDGQRNVYQHIADLADLCGFDRYLDRDGKLVFAFFVGGRVTHVFEHAAHIIALDVHHRPVAADEVRTIGESPGAAKGDNSWAWLTTDFSPFEGHGGGPPALGASTTVVIARSVLRSGRAAQQAAQAALTDLKRRTFTGEVLVAGDPKVRLGDAVRIANVPESGIDGTYQVRGVRHQIDKSNGFTTWISFRSIEQ